MHCGMPTRDVPPHAARMTDRAGRLKGRGGSVFVLGAPGPRDVGKEIADTR